MALYGWALRYRVGIAQDQPRAKQLLQQSNNSMARAWCLLNGIGVSQDYNAGFRMLNTECDASDLHVQFMLGDCHYLGWGCSLNVEQAVHNFERAGNHVAAMKNLGWMFATGYNVARDDARAVALLRRAAEQGYRDAQHCLAYMYEHGKGVPKDSQLAKHWYTMARSADAEWMQQ
eukprot:TRINITY_DN3096_c1_g1_i1.p1 TRINITY_DN3096_c1_g1~~TRINITY_DN3096_c1_g1_i1.p1  ORF type:complete len:190 (+),score=46.74 TRINITY_DN3096_c1_g1_i1:46-570(+)